LVGGVKKELHHGRSTEVDELINKMEKPLVAEGLFETQDSCVDRSTWRLL